MFKQQTSFSCFLVKSQSFAAIGVGESGQSEALASGISNALLTTATGLVIAIPAVIMYNYFVNRANSTIAQMENISNDIAEIILSSKK